MSADGKLVVLLRVPLLTKVEVRNFPELLFSRWLCLAHLQFAISLRRVKRSVIWKYQSFCLFDTQLWSVLSQELFFLSQKSPFEGIQVSVSCYTSTLNFQSPKYYSQYSSLEERRKALFKMFLFVFSILTIGKHNDI